MLEHEVISLGGRPEGGDRASGVFLPLIVLMTVVLTLRASHVFLPLTSLLPSFLPSFLHLVVVALILLILPVILMVLVVPGTLPLPR